MHAIGQIMQKKPLGTAYGTHANQDLKKKTTLSTSSTTEAARKRIDRLFLSFSSCYGQLWRSQFKNDEFIEFMKSEWVNALRDVEDKYFQEAVAYCQSKKEFPPTLPYFVELCRNAEKRTVFMKMPNYKKSCPEIAALHLEKMRAMLK